MASLGADREIELQAGPFLMSFDFAPWQSAAAGKPYAGVAID